MYLRSNDQRAGYIYSIKWLAEARKKGNRVIMVAGNLASIVSGALPNANFTPHKSKGDYLDSAGILSVGL
jgi:hypothetical protein